MTTLSNRDRYLTTITKPYTKTVYKKHVFEGSAVLVGFNLAPVCSKKTSIVSTSTWEVEKGGSVSLSGDSKTDISTYVLASSSSSGPSLLKNTIVLSNGETLVEYLEVNVHTAPEVYDNDYKDNV